MALPAVLWAAASGRGFWYPVNLLAGMLLPGPGNLEGAELGRFHAELFLAACARSTSATPVISFSFYRVRPIATASRSASASGKTASSRPIRGGRLQWA